MEMPAGQELAGGVLLQSVALHEPVDQLIGGVFGTKSDDGHQLAIGRHTLLAPVKGPNLLQIVGIHGTESK
jgi:hypothetical protein